MRDIDGMGEVLRWEREGVIGFAWPSQNCALLSSNHKECYRLQLFKIDQYRNCRTAVMPILSGTYLEA